MKSHFSTRAQYDPATGARAGLLDAYATHRENVPKLMMTNTGYEYWGRAGSLIHTTLDGEADIELDENE